MTFFQSVLFQFPSNGKVDTKFSRCGHAFLGVTCFNSLQTGRCIQSDSIVFHRLHYHVSIPFKREGVYKEAEARKATEGIRFQFPSNGKVYTKVFLFLVFVFAAPPFQFPSNGKVYPKLYSEHINVLYSKFQFPSNGKVYPKKAAMELVVVLNPTGFNSLQTGRCIQRPHFECPIKKEFEFQFPSNGKVYTKGLLHNST